MMTDDIKVIKTATLRAFPECRRFVLVGPLVEWSRAEPTRLERTIVKPVKLRLIFDGAAFDLIDLEAKELIPLLDQIDEAAKKRRQKNKTAPGKPQAP